MATIYVFQMDVEHANLFHSKALQNLSKMGFLFCLYLATLERTLFIVAFITTLSCQ
jgi:hypothetical protein